MREVLVLAATSFAVYAAIFSPLERVFPARAGQAMFRRAWGTDLVFFLGQQLLWGGLVIGALALVQSRIGGWLPAGWFEAVASQPTWLRIAEVILLGDVAVYWTHRAFHQFEFLWRFHQIHHTSETLDWLAAHREHPVDGLCTALVQNLPAFLLGFSVESVAPFVVFRGLWALFIHSNVRLPLGPLRVIFGAPELHHWHHARVERTRHNFANLAPWTDLLFGTYHCPEGEETYALGVPERVPGSYVGLLMAPWRGREQKPREDSAAEASAS